MPPILTVPAGELKPVCRNPTETAALIRAETLHRAATLKDTLMQGLSLAAKRPGLAEGCVQRKDSLGL